MHLHDGGTNTKERVKEHGEVFTPVKVVNAMLDMLEENSADCFNPEMVFLDPTCGEGQFPLEILRRKFKGCKKKQDFETAALSVWGMDIQADNVEIAIGNVLELCKEHFKVSKKIEEEIKTRYILCDSLKVLHLLAMYQGEMLVHVLGEGKEQDWLAFSGHPKNGTMEECDTISDIKSR